MYDITCTDINGNPIEYFTQWDVGQKIYIRDLKLSEAPLVHFTNVNRTNALTVNDATLENGVLVVKVPNELLSEPYRIIVYLYEYDLDTRVGKTIHTGKIEIRRKTKPDDYIYKETVAGINIVALDARVRTLMNREKEISSDITSLKSRTDNLESRLSSANLQISDHTRRITNIENVEIPNLKAADTNLDNRISQETQRIDGEIQNLTEKDSAIESDISSINENIEQLQSTDSGLSDRISALETDNESNKNSISENTDAISNLSSSLSSLESSVTSEVQRIDGEISQLQSADSALDGRITALESDNTNNKNAISENSNSIAELSSSINSLSETVASETSRIDSEISDVKTDINDNTTQISELKSDLAELVSDDVVEDIDLISGYTQGYIYLNNDTVGVSTNSLYGRIDNISLENGDRIDIYTYASASYPKTIPISKNNGDGTYTVLTEPTETGKALYTYTATEEIEVCVSFNIQAMNNDRHCKITKIGHSIYDDLVSLSDKVAEAETIIVNLQDDVEKIKEENPLKKTDFDIGFARQLKSVTFVGDSYTQGNFDRTNGSAMTWDDVNYYSIPSVFGRLTGAEVHNSGISGATASDSEEAKTKNVSYLKLASMGGRNFISESDKSIAYYIFLGINDSGSLGGFSGDVETDIDIENYENCNRDTSVGAYAYIIGKIRSIQPNAIIFCETPSNVISPYNLTNSKIYTEVAPKVRQICEKLNCECVDMQMYFHPNEQDAKEWHNSHYNGGHPNALGYYEMAVAKASYIGWLIKNNPLKYRNIQFIGTNMDY